MRERFEKNKVIVFPASALQPWDNVARFNFLECNLKEVVDKGLPFKKDKVITKDTFVGQINQLKTAKAATPERKTEYPDLNSPLKKPKTEQKKIVKTQKP